MKGFNRTLRWFTASVLMVTMSAVPALADLKKKDPKRTPATDKNTAVPAVPRGIPDLVPYWAYDPPASSLFDINKLTFSGDLRVRPEYRTNAFFGQTPAAGKRNDMYIQQWMRLGINYSVSPDVEVFFQPQYAKNFGAASINGAGNQATNGSCAANICANDAFNVGTGESFFVRQAFVLVRNVGIENLSLKLGRQLIVFGNHRLFGHFDWANTGFSHDAITAQYAAKYFNITAGFARGSDKDFNTFGGNATVFGVAPPGVGGPQAPAATDSSNDADFWYARGQFKPIKGLSLEPMWVYFYNGGPNSAGGTGVPGGTPAQAHAANQNRHTVGGRVAFKKSMFDMNGEFYWQFGSMGVLPGNSPRNLSINAYAGAVQAGITLPVPMQPRIGVEYDIASGDGNNTTCGNGVGGTSVAGCGGNANTFEQLYPTNHILFGYMDLFAWRNMIAYSGNFQMRPTKNSHFEIWGNIFRKQQAGDNWYRAAQNVYFTANGGNCGNFGGTCTSSSLGQEVDVIYTMFFKDNKVGWQVGYGHFFPGEFVEQFTGQANPAGQDWAYTQVHVNF